MSAPNNSPSFFRQSGWMMIASTIGGCLMFAVHAFAPGMGKAEYGLFGTLLQMLNLMMIPALGLQTVFAQQTAAAVSESQQRQLRATARAILISATLLWVVMAVLTIVFKSWLISTLSISNPAALWATVAFVLPQLWLPVFQGVLQGRQDFLGMGWIGILNGLTRLVAVAFLVMVFHGKAAAGMIGALAGQTLALCIAAWRAQGVLKGPGEPFDAKGWLGRLWPLTVGLGVGQFMLSADMIVVRAVFEPSQTGVYGWSGMIGRGLVMFTAPLVWVMFPRVVESQARAERTNVLTQALLATGVLAGLAAAVATLLCKLAPGFLQALAQGTPPVNLPKDLASKLLEHHTLILEVGRLIPFFVWCMLPLTLAVVLVNNLLAQARYRAVPWLAVTAAAYAAALTVWNKSFEQVIVTLGVFSLALLVVAAGFSCSQTASRRGPKEAK